MSKTTDHLSPPGTVGSTGRRREVVVVAAVAVLVLVTAAIVVWWNLGGEDTTTATAPSTTAPPAGAEQTTTEAPATTERPTTTTGAPSAADALEPFLTAAATLDTRLEAAATAINGGGPPWSEVTSDMASAVQGADLEAVAKTVPAGLPHDLLQAVILVYSDLSSRRHAMESFTYPSAHPRTTSELLTELGYGHAAADRFDDDLADLRSLVGSAPPVGVVSSDSRAAAEALLYVQFVELANGGCDSRGGAVFTELPPLDWNASTPASPDIGIPEWDGHVGGIEFSADHNPNGTWDIVIWAC